MATSVNALGKVTASVSMGWLRITTLWLIRLLLTATIVNRSSFNLASAFGICISLQGVTQGVT